MGLRGWQLGLRAWEWLFSVLVMALIGNMIASAFAGNPASVNYAMFCSAFSIVSLFYLVPASWNIDWAIHPILMIVVDTLNAIFFLASAIVLSARLEVHDCANRAYTSRNNITNGAHNQEKRCREGQASAAFLWFVWAGYTASMVLSFLMSRRAGAKLRPRTGPARGMARPSMAQV